MTLEELKKRSEAAHKLELSGDKRIYDMEILNAPPQFEAFIQATAPATVLKLLEMIEVLKEGIGMIEAEKWLDRAEELERSL